jgi:hypothetical protein
MSEFVYNPGIAARAKATLYHHIGVLFGKYRANPLYTAILEAFHRALPVAAGEILTRQIELFNHYSRWKSSVGSEVAFSLYRGLGFKEINSEYKFKFNIPSGFPVGSARISARRVNSGPSARVDLYIFGGRCDGLDFDVSPKKIFGSYNPPLDNILISDVKILFDPMNPDPFPTFPSNDFSALPEWVRSRIANCPGASTSTPLSTDLRDKLIDYYDLPFPDDYLELVSTAEYVSCPDSFEILGLSKIWMYMTRAYYMIVLADVFDAGAIALLRGAPPGVYFVDRNLDHIAMYMGNSLKTALYRVLDEGEDAIIETSKEYNS